MAAPQPPAELLTCPDGPGRPPPNADARVLGLVLAEALDAGAACRARLAAVRTWFAVDPQS